jgi:hypothetical protein
MTRAELAEEVLQGILLIVGEYRGSHAEEAGYVDRKFGNAIRYIRAIHLAECAWHGHIEQKQSCLPVFFPAAGETTALPLDI